jgi:hypothetical protein
VADDFFLAGSLGQRVPYGQSRDPRLARLADVAQCRLCGAHVDVGGEIKEHTESHQVEPEERW